MKNFLKRLFRRFKAIPYRFLRRLASNEFRQFECERILGDRKMVRDFGRFYEENEEEMRYLSFIFQHKLDNSAISFIKFFQQCAFEGEQYRLQVDRDLYNTKVKEYREAKREKDKEKMAKLKKEINILTGK